MSYHFTRAVMLLAVLLYAGVSYNVASRVAITR